MSSDLSPGTIFAERFVIEATAGRGGMGVVLRALDLTDNNIVALKLLHSLDEKNQTRFQREAALLAELQHPGIVAAQIALAQNNPQAAEQEARAAVACLQVAPPLFAEALALLSEALLAQNAIEASLEPALEAMKILESGGGVESGELVIRLSLYCALFANNDNRAGEVLSTAKERLLARADKISDQFWRESFLYQVQVNARLLSM